MRTPYLCAVLFLGVATAAQGQDARWTVQTDARAYAGYFDQNTRAGTSGLISTAWLMLNLQYGSPARTLGAHVMLSSDALIHGDCSQPRLLPERFDCGDATSMSHPLVMGLGLSGQARLRGTALRLSASVVGEPAYGPPPHFMRASAQHDLGEPLTQHFFTPVHAAQGVVTAGVTRGALSVEASAFNARNEHDPYRITLAPLRAAAARISFAVSPRVGLQLSSAYFPADEAGGHHGHAGAMRAYSLTASGAFNDVLYYTAGCAAHHTAQRTPAVCLLESTLARGPHIFFARVEGGRRLEQVTEAIVNPDGSHAHVVVNHMMGVSEVAGGYGVRLPERFGVRPSAGIRAGLTAIPEFFRLRYNERHAASLTVFLSARLGSPAHLH